MNMDLIDLMIRVGKSLHIVSVCLARVCVLNLFVMKMKE